MPDVDATARNRTGAALPGPIPFSGPETWLADAIVGIGPLAIGFLVVNDGSMLAVDTTTAVKPIPVNPVKRASSLALHLIPGDSGHALSGGRGLPEPRAARVFVKTVDTLSDTIFRSRDFDSTNNQNPRSQRWANPRRDLVIRSTCRRTDFNPAA